MHRGKGADSVLEANANRELRLSAHSDGKNQPTAWTGEHDFQLTEYQVPVLASGTPVIGDALEAQAERPALGIIIGKAGLVARNLTKLTVEALDNIYCVYDLVRSYTG